MRLAPNEVAWLAINVGKWTADEAKTMVAICYAESNGDIFAVNDRYPPNWDLGLFQISTRWHDAKLQRYRWRDPYDNTRMARLVYDEFIRRPEGDGFLAWAVYKNGLHLPHLPMAELAVAHPWEPINPHTTGWRYR